MKMKITEVRLTLAAIIYAIENDLKNSILSNIIPNFDNFSFIKSNDLVGKLKQRFLDDFPDLDPELNLEDVVEYLDFQDRFQILLSNKDIISSELIDYLKSIQIDINKITPIRNRVMHTRPLLEDDFSTVYSFANSINGKEPLGWVNLLETKKNIEFNPNWVFTLTLPFVEDEGIINNLPLPDFDDTGFIGRKSDVAALKKLVLGSFPVVTVIGDGGIGKSALALKVAYDVLDLREECPFDIVIWVSAKTTVLTEKGIEEIHNALTSIGSIVSEISSELSSSSATAEYSEQVSSILEYFDVYETLLILDNLETIHNDITKNFIWEASQRCKILITSRIGLGELEYRRELKEFTESESIQLIRRLTSMGNNKDLNKISNSVWKGAAKKLHYNPLALKWFVKSIISGATPNEVLSNTDRLLEFCLSNVYGKLSDNAKKVISIILSSRKGSLTIAEIIYLSELDALSVRESINELFSTTLLFRDTNNTAGLQEYKYSLTSFARNYILKFHPIDGTFSREIFQKIKELSASTSDIENRTIENKFSVNSMKIRNTNEKVVAKSLFDGLKYSKKKDYAKAIDKLNLAESIAPEYFEVYRVRAFIQANSDNLILAEDDYHKALELEPKNPKVLYFYSGFLLDKLGDEEAALEYSSQLIQLEPLYSDPYFLAARCNLRGQKFAEGIKIIEECLTNDKISKNTQNKIIGYSLLINAFNLYATYLAEIKKEYNKSIAQFILGIDAFKRCINYNVFDIRTLRTFVKFLYSLCKNIDHLHLNKEQERLIYKVVRENIERIVRATGDTNILDFLTNKYGFIWEGYNDIEIDKGKLYGFLSIRNLDLNNKSFVFITTPDNERIIAHRSEFINVRSNQEWINMKDRTEVTYYEGDFQGNLAAKGVFLINNNSQYNA